MGGLALLIGGDTVAILSHISNRTRPGYMSPVTTYVALLRGINVGGKNLIKMPELKACFEAGGFDEGAYIQSGNVLPRTAVSRAAALASRIERILTDAFDPRSGLGLRLTAFFTSLPIQQQVRFPGEPPTEVV